MNGAPAITGLKHISFKDIFMEVTVLFFGVLAEVAQTAVKNYRDVSSLGELKHRIGDDFPGLMYYSFRISVNNELVNNDTTLTSGDEIALMPPFAGG